MQNTSNTGNNNKKIQPIKPIRCALPTTLGTCTPMLLYVEEASCEDATVLFGAVGCAVPLSFLLLLRLLSVVSVDSVRSVVAVVAVVAVVIVVSEISELFEMSTDLFALFALLSLLLLLRPWSLCGVEVGGVHEGPWNNIETWNKWVDKNTNKQPQTTTNNQTTPN